MSLSCVSTTFFLLLPLEYNKLLTNHFSHQHNRLDISAFDKRNMLLMRYFLQESSHNSMTGSSSLVEKLGFPIPLSMQVPFFAPWNTLRIRIMHAQVSSIEYWIVGVVFGY